MNRRIIPTIWGGVGISRNWATAHFLVFDGELRTVTAPVGVPFSLLMCFSEVQGLVDVDLSTILDLFGSNQFMSCPSVQFSR